VAFFLDSIARANPRVRLDTIGRTLENRPLLVVKIGERDDSPERPNVIFMASYHAREWVATEMALRLIRYLAQSPSPDARVDSLIQRRDVWILPVANPDGYQYTFSTDRLWRKNRRPNADGSVGVDLNRNHAAGWGLDDEGSSPSPASEVYRGPAPESELETRAIVAFHQAHPPVLSASYHSYTGLVLYPPGNTYGKVAQDLGVFQSLAGTDVHPSVIDRLPGSNRSHYHPAPSWNLYTTNGDYTDWAYGALGALAFTPELTSGFEGTTYYGFEFPEDETKLQTVFTDNLPFALDLLDAAADPLHARPRSSGVPSEPVALESAYPIVRARVPAGELATAAIRGGSAPLLFTIDTVGPGRYTKRLLAPAAVRPVDVSVTVAGGTSRFQILSDDGAEPRDAMWTATGDFARGVPALAGVAAWVGGNGGALRSSPIAVPGDADTVSVLFWTRYLGDGFDLRPHGELRVSADDGLSWTPVGLVAGSAPAYYPERADLVGYAGRTVRLSFEGSFGISQSWWLDEIQVVAHRRVPVDVVPVAAAPLASENPVRGATVRFAWPFGDSTGEIDVYDFSGQRVWKSGVGGVSSLPIVWDVAGSGARNGVYLVVARSQGRTRTLKLFIARRR
ncbi:MAG: M14 family zinc carboxypeptidase, partial [Gemmatimonadaceae bacterium]